MKIYKKNNKGLAEIKTSPILQFELELFSFGPKSIGTGGGNSLTISGKGFNGNKVLVDGIECQTVASNSTTIECTLPPSVSFTCNTIRPISYDFLKPLFLIKSQLMLTNQLRSESTTQMAQLKHTKPSMKSLPTRQQVLL